MIPKQKPNCVRVCFVCSVMCVLWEWLWAYWASVLLSPYRRQRASWSMQDWSDLSFVTFYMFNTLGYSFTVYSSRNYRSLAPSDVWSHTHTHTFKTTAKAQSWLTHSVSDKRLKARNSTWKGNKECVTHDSSLHTFGYLAQKMTRTLASRLILSARFAFGNGKGGRKKKHYCDTRQMSIPAAKNI